MITVEDGTIVANADSYVSVADADAYFEGHGEPAEWEEAVTAQKEAGLKYATKWLDNKMRWYSCIVDTSQVLDWPRKAFRDSEGRSIGGEGNMPQALLDATCEMAIAWIRDPLQNPQAAIRRERIGSSEVEFLNGTGDRKTYSYAYNILTELGIPKSGIIPIYRS